MAGDPRDLSDAEYWARYYQQVHAAGTPWLDYSNARVQAQTLALSLEAVGEVQGRACLDVGSGQGQFARCLLALGAQPVTAIELVAETIAKLRAEQPGIAWRQGSADDHAAYAGLPPQGLITALEVLQYVPFAGTVRLLWGLLAPGGRLVGMIPNRECPIVAKPMARFPGRFRAVTATDIAAALGDLPGCAAWSLRGLSFATDQTVAPYQVSDWSRTTAWSRPPNRFLFVAIRGDGG